MLIEHEKFELTLLARGAANRGPRRRNPQGYALMRETLEKMDAKKGSGERIESFIDPELRWLTPKARRRKIRATPGECAVRRLRDPLMVWRDGRDTLLSTAQVRGAAGNY
jgi:hypothetical protein